MIRPATAADKDRVVELLRDSREGAGFDSEDGPTGFTFPFSPNHAERLFLAHTISKRSLCVVNEESNAVQGILMALAYEHPFGPVWIAKETVWWIDPAHRGRSAVHMLGAYESWAKKQGCKFVGMAGMGTDPEVAKLYLRRGYRAAETHFLKAV